MKISTNKSFARALLEGKTVSLTPVVAIPNGKMSTYTVYQCNRNKCGYYYKTPHGGICPKCGGKLEAAMCSLAFYEAALP